MPHLHTEPGEHDHTASAYIVRTDGEQPRLLLHKHKLLGVYMQFGGHIETDETPWQSITHEISEEAGYDMDQLRVLQPAGRLQDVSGAVLHPQPVCHITHPFSDENHFHTDIAYAFITDEEPARRVAEGESADIRLFTHEQLCGLEKDETIENVREIGAYVLTECVRGWEAVSCARFK